MCVFLCTYVRNYVVQYAPMSESREADIAASIIMFVSEGLNQLHALIVERDRRIRHLETQLAALADEANYGTGQRFVYYKDVVDWARS